MIWIQIAVFVGVVAVSWIVFQYVGSVYKKHAKLTLPAVTAETAVFVLHGCSGTVYLAWNGEGVPNQVFLALGAVFVALGLVGTLTAMRHLGWGATFGQGTGTKSEAARPVANSGLYRYSRNPQLVAYLLFLVGCVLLWPKWAGIAWLVLYGVIAWIMVHTEEKHLKEAHPNLYPHYCEETPRWIGTPRKAPYFE